MHVDLAAKNPQEEIERLIGLGALKVEYRESNGRGWTVILDPGTTSSALAESADSPSATATLKLGCLSSSGSGP
jgi:hypothetical protein